jgi:hypothetical protein
MSLANYTDLQAALGNWLDHSLFAARYPDFVTLFEATANRRLRVRAMEATVMLTPNPTALLLHCNGADNSTAFPDSAFNPNLVTAHGNAKILSAQFKFGGASASFDGLNTSYLSIPDSASLRLPNDFTIDFWINISSSLTPSTWVIFKGPSNNSFASWLVFFQGGQLSFWSSSNGTSWDISDAQHIGTIAATGAWHHVAISRQGSTWYLFLDGNLNATFSDPSTMHATADAVTIGGNNYFSQAFNGYLDEIRISNGARWTANFTPPASPAGVAAGGFATLPADYLAWRRLTWTGKTRNELGYVHPSYFQAAFPSQPADVPKIFTIEGQTLKVMPIDATPLELDYYQLIPALAANATNWLMIAHPDLYLFGSMVEAEMFGANDERMPAWKARRDEILDEIVRLDARTRGPSAIRVFGATP